MSDNVIVFGAGSSADAGIPMLRSFYDVLEDYATYTDPSKLIPEQQEKIHNLKAAVSIRDYLLDFHRTSNFNDRDIEQIMSVLSFNVLSKSESSKNDFRVFSKAIANTVELSCDLTESDSLLHQTSFFSSSVNVKTAKAHEFYHRFWERVFSFYSATKDFPTIISLNYDLVLERSLYSFFNSAKIQSYQKPVDTLEINYGLSEHNPPIYSIFKTNYAANVLKTMKTANKESNHLKFNFYKLHGSLNFPDQLSEFNFRDNEFFKSAKNPLIIPPIANKNYSEIIENVWAEALTELRDCKHLIFAGYSMPKTDVSMQFFLKTALGPNKKLRKIFVYDPILSNNNECSKNMEDRYRSCFSEQLRDRIFFNPQFEEQENVPLLGSFAQLIDHLNTKGKKRILL